MTKRLKSKGAAIALLVLLAGVTGGCLGPKPVLQSFQVEPPSKGSDQPYKVEAVVSNVGPGAGEIVVEVNLSNKRTGEFIAKEAKEVDLQKDETVHVLVEVDLPPSAQELDSQDIDVDVDAHYPIQ
jgi:hypothetical protein